MIQWFLAKFELYKFDKKILMKILFIFQRVPKIIVPNKFLASFTDKKTEVDL